MKMRRRVALFAVLAFSTIASIRCACVTVKTQSIQCSSWGFKPAECDVDGVISDVSVNVKHSKSACALDSSYGFTENKLWVKSGCRATFFVKVITNECQKKVTCSSLQYKRATCPVLGKVLGLKVETKRSKSACVLGKSYGIQGSQLWVDKGCRATFDVHVKDVCHSITSNQLACSSLQFKPASCAVGGAPIAVKVATKKSRSACVLDTSFGLRADNVWVDKGCRASFTVYYLTNKCKDVSIKCQSWNFKPGTCEADGLILSATVSAKHSRSSCVINQSFGFLDNDLWVAKGCRATFKVKVAEN